MNVVYKPRNSGKTYDLVTNHFIGKDNNYLIVRNLQEKHRIARKFNLSLEESRRILTLGNMENNFRGTHKNPKIVIDNVDVFLENYFCREFGGEIEAVSINKPEEIKKPQIIPDELFEI